MKSTFTPTTGMSFGLAFAAALAALLTASVATATAPASEEEPSEQGLPTTDARQKSPEKASRSDSTAPADDDPFGGTPQPGDPFATGQDPFRTAQDPFREEVDPFGGGRDSDHKEKDPFGGGQDPFNGQGNPFGGAPSGVDPFSDSGSDPFGAPVRPRLRGRPSTGRSESARPQDAEVGSVRSELLANYPANEQRILNALNDETNFEYLDAPLADVAQDISFRHDIPIIIDTLSLRGQGKDADLPVAISLRGVSLSAALRLMLRSLELAFFVDDEVLILTTESMAHRTEQVSSLRCPRLALG